MMLLKFTSNVMFSNYLQVLREVLRLPLVVNIEMSNLVVRTRFMSPVLLSLEQLLASFGSLKLHHHNLFRYGGEFDSSEFSCGGGGTSSV